MEESSTKTSNKSKFTLQYIYFVKIGLYNSLNHLDKYFFLFLSYCNDCVLQPFTSCVPGMLSRKFEYYCFMPAQENWKKNIPEGQQRNTWWPHTHMEDKKSISGNVWELRIKIPISIYGIIIMMKIFISFCNLFRLPYSKTKFYKWHCQQNIVIFYLEVGWLVRKSTVMIL